MFAIFRCVEVAHIAQQQRAKGGEMEHVFKAAGESRCFQLNLIHFKCEVLMAWKYQRVE